MKVRLILDRRFCLAVSLAALTAASPAGAGSILRIGPCVNPHCNVPPPNSGFIAVATGNYHSMGLRSDGSIAAWGMCDVGQCDVPSPNSGFTAISAGDSHSLGLRFDGSIVAWGSNENGELYVPAPNTGFVAIAAGLLHNLALKSNGSIVGWGSNLGGASVPPEPTANRGLGDALAAEWGHGRRQGLLSNLHLGARDPSQAGRFWMLGKTFKGLTDAMLRELTAELPRIAVEAGPHLVRVRPERVVEIAFDGVQRSPRYDSGLALRFARVKRFRPDKTAEEATTLTEIRKIAGREG